MRKAAGIEFAGWDATTSGLIAEVEWSEEPAWGIRTDAVGTHAIGKLDDGQRARVVLTEAHAGSACEPTLRDVSDALLAVYGTDYGIHSPVWISRFDPRTKALGAYVSELLGMDEPRNRTDDLAALKPEDSRAGVGDRLAGRGEAPKRRPVRSCPVPEDGAPFPSVTTSSSV